MDVETRIEIAKAAASEEARLWQMALKHVRCILPDDAQDVEAEVKRLRQVKAERYGRENATSQEQ